MKRGLLKVRKRRRRRGKRAGKRARKKRSNGLAPKRKQVRLQAISLLSSSFLAWRFEACEEQVESGPRSRGTRSLRRCRTGRDANPRTTFRDPGETSFSSLQRALEQVEGTALRGEDVGACERSLEALFASASRSPTSPFSVDSFEAREGVQKGASSAKLYAPHARRPTAARERERRGAVSDAGLCGLVRAP